MNDAKTIRVLVADDQQLIRHGIATLLQLEEGFCVVGQAENGQVAIEKARDLKPDVVLMDIQMPVISGIDALRTIRQEQPDCQVLMLTTFDDDEYIVQAFRAGSCGYLLKDIPSHDLAQAVRLANAGVYQLAPEVVGKLVGDLFMEKRGKAMLSSAEIPVTPREKEVLQLLASGASNKEIATQLVISEGTVKKHITNILNTLNLRDRTQAAIYAVKHNLA